MTFQPAFALWPIAPFGGEQEDNNNKDGANAGNGSGGGTEGESGKGGDGASGGKADPPVEDGDDDDDDEYKGLSAAELRKIAKDNAKAAKDHDKEAKRLKGIQDAEERKKHDDVTNLTKDLDKERGMVATLRATVVKQAIEGAIRDDERYRFHDVEMVASVAVQINSDITVSDDGKVEGLKATLPKVAKQHPFLVSEDKTVKNDDGKNGAGNGNGNNGSGNGANGPTGFQPGQGGTSGGSGVEVDVKKLAENYPALAARI